MKITELLEQRQQVDELNMAQVGNAIGKGATAVGKGIGATASGAVQTGKNLWQGLKQGWKAGQAAVAGDPAAPAPTAPQEGSFFTPQYDMGGQDFGIADNSSWDDGGWDVSGGDW